MSSMDGLGYQCRGTLGQESPCVPDQAAQPTSRCAPVEPLGQMPMVYAREMPHIFSMAQPSSVKRWVYWLVASLVESYMELIVMTFWTAFTQVPDGYTRNTRLVGNDVTAAEAPGPVATPEKASCQSYTNWTRAPRDAKPAMISALARVRSLTPLRRIQSARIWVRIQNGMTTSRVAVCSRRIRYLMSITAMSTADIT